MSKKKLMNEVLPDPTLSKGGDGNARARVMPTYNAWRAAPGLRSSTSTRSTASDSKPLNVSIVQ